MSKSTPLPKPAPGAKRFEATYRGARISPFKARPVVDLVRGKPIDKALKLLEFEPRRAAPMVRKVLKSALANAGNDMGVKLHRLVVVEARVDGGPLLSGRRRFRPRAMGRAFPIMKRTSHIRVALAETGGEE
jgi:large subunit ribosomal protein L22